MVSGTILLIYNYQCYFSITFTLFYRANYKIYKTLLVYNGLGICCQVDLSSKLVQNLTIKSYFTRILDQRKHDNISPMVDMVIAKHNYLINLIL